MAVLALSAWACGGDHFLTDKEYREKVHADFLSRKELAAGRAKALFSVMDRKELTTKQKEALEFLYAYMPLCDLSEYDGDYFLRQVDGAFRARGYFHWGKSVPEDIFRHFVLVHRVNNEYMDEARDVFFEELKDRIKDMTMYDAALEVNHWCHEKVTYRGTDARTSAPLALVRTSWGRCGEESTFTVAALRSVGIPAHQCYTPRWVHTDSNHAWVEVWIDGRWRYMGACEPEPELDVAWFDGPVQRAMMTHATVYGLYNGPEEKNIETPLYSVINTLSNYAATRRASVTVVDVDGKTVPGARVQFKVYNYAELYPLATLQSDSEGKATVKTGLGDLMVWANKGDAYGYVKSKPGEAEITVVLERKPGDPYTETYALAAPDEQPFNELPEEKTAANTIRLAFEDSLRNAYMATFPTKEYARKVAQETGLDEDRVWHCLYAAQGNWLEIEKLIRENGQAALQILATLREKDLRDTPADYLKSYLREPATDAGYLTGDDSENILWKYILSPRISYERIAPFRDFFPGDDSGRPAGVSGIIEYVRTNVRVSDPDNYYNCLQTPSGVHTLKVADRKSRAVYFVAMCRASDIPARLEPATGTPQYLDPANGQWTHVDFEAGDAGSALPARGKLTVKNDPGNIVTPGYGSHFTIAIYKDGDFRTLDLGSYFAGNDAGLNVDMGGNATRALPLVIPLEEGYYRLMTGSRANDGSVAVEAQYFTLSEEKPHTVTVRLPDVGDKLFVKGIVDMNSVVAVAGEKTTLKSLSKGQGAILCFADPGKEPTRHLLQEIPAHRQALEEWGGAVVFLTPGDKRRAGFDPEKFPGQPSQTVWADDAERELLNQVAAALQITFRDNFPLVVYLTGNGGVVFSSEGYRIGIFGEVMKTINRERRSLSSRQGVSPDKGTQP